MIGSRRTQQKMRQIGIFTAVMALALLVSSVAEACPNCKNALAAQDEAGGDVIAGYFWSILFMMSMPFLILTFMGSYMYLLVRRARARGEAAGGVPARCIISDDPIHQQFTDHEDAAIGDAEQLIEV